MKSKLTKVLVLSLILIMVFGTVYASAYSSYDTYTYSIDGEPLASPEAFTASLTAKSAQMNLLTEKFGNKELNRPNDIVTDVDGNVYIADSGNNRIVVLNKYYAAIDIIENYRT